jgi:uracil-DNA glycosylase
MAGFAVPESWAEALAPVLAAESTARLAAFLGAERAAGKQIFPPESQVFQALELTALPQVRAVILGQDPYPTPGEAHGLSFSVQDGVRVPRSLANIYKELESDLGLPRPAHGNLTRWAMQGVLLLNDLLTVERGSPLGHRNRGWEPMTDAVIAAVAARPEPCVFLLWGDKAKAKIARVPGLTQGGRHLLLKAAHPSPLAARRGFFGCRHFSRANEFLAANGRGAIDWQV